MNASSSSDDDDAPGASTWEGEDETSEANGDSNAAGKRARRVEAAATKRLSLSERLRRRAPAYFREVSELPVDGAAELPFSGGVECFVLQLARRRKTPRPECESPPAV